MNDLIETWRNTCARDPSRLALTEAAAGRHWTFRELDGASDDRARAMLGQAIATPGGDGANFVIDALAAWKAGAMFVPVERESPAPDLSPVDGIPAGVVMAKMTSGSTGAARAVLFTAAQLLADVSNIVRTMGLHPDLPNLGAISLAHSYGFSNLVLPLIVYGIPLHLAGSPLPEAMRLAIAAAGAVALPGVPVLWRAWHSAGIIDARIRIAMSAGAALPCELESGVFNSTGVKIHNFLGSSECGGIAYDRSTTPRSDGALAGTALEDVGLEVDADGCLIVRSEAVGESHWPPSDADNRTLGHGRFRTGDLAELRDGFVYLSGRAGDTINVAGRKVHPVEIEACLRRHPAVVECVVFGVPASGGRGEEVVACVVLRAGHPLPERLNDWMASHLPPWKCPRHWRLAPDLGPDERGKISRWRWRERFLSGRL